MPKRPPLDLVRETDLRCEGAGDFRGGGTAPESFGPMVLSRAALLGQVATGLLGVSEAGLRQRKLETSRRRVRPDGSLLPPRVLMSHDPLARAHASLPHLRTPPAIMHDLSH